MLRFATLFALAALCLSGSALAAGAEALPVLKASVTVASDIVRIGDLVDNAGPAANVPIFRAPDLGETGSVPVARVLDAMRAHNLVGIDAGGLSEISVTHDARVITRQHVEAAIAKALAGRNGLGDAQSLTATLDREPRPLYVETTITQDLQVSRISYDPRSGRFDATLDLPGSSLFRRDGLRVAGMIAETVEVPVITRQVSRGELIKASDVGIERRSKAELSGDTIASADQVAGFAARRALRSGQTVRTADVMRPEVVQRNDTVTLVYEVPGIMLTVRVKALESGAEGDVINVLNQQSKRTLQATVTGPGRVSITPANSPVVGSAGAPIRTSLATNPVE